VRSISTQLQEESSAMPPIEGAIRRKIEADFAPVHLYEVENESYKHNVPKGSESHFKVLIVSDVFEGKSMIQRHRMVNSTLKDELSGKTPGGGKIHALSIQAKTPSQWQAAESTGNAAIQSTPNCLGGSKS
jgi:stress-induced morphogen